MAGIAVFKKALVLAAALVAVSVRPAATSQDIIRIVTNYPNPFDSRSGATTIVYDLPVESEVQITIYDLLGGTVREYPARREQAGLRQIMWDGTNESGDKVAKGGYLCVVNIAANDARVLATRKIGVVH
jgi:flagellar hook assembly protein FlgD